MSSVGSELPRLGRGEDSFARFGSKAQQYIALTKPKIQIMLIFTAYIAMLVSSHGLPSARTTIFTLVGLVLATGGSAAINMWYDRDIDVVMSRTVNRPLPLGTVHPTGALVFGLILIAISFLTLTFFINMLTAVLALGGAFYYAVVYTMLLKRRTPQNIVIGGGAGAFPPLVGWAGVTGHVGMAAVIMFAIIFLWTPPHFWALALFKNDDYRKANIPMMPVVRGAQSTKRQSVAYAVLLLLVSLTLYLTGTVHLLYVVIAGLCGVAFLAFNVVLLRSPDRSMKWAKRTFFASLLYLPIVFLGMVFNNLR